MTEYPALFCLLTAANSRPIDPCHPPPCSNDYVGVMIPCPSNCSRYLECVQQDSWNWIGRECAPGTVFDNTTSTVCVSTPCQDHCASSGAANLPCFVLANSSGFRFSSFLFITFARHKCHMVADSCYTDVTPCGWDQTHRSRWSFERLILASFSCQCRQLGEQPVRTIS